MLFEGVTIAWVLLALFLVVGLVIHEKTGSRLGGVLVLPLILIYSLVDLSVLLVFSVGALVSFLMGQYFYSYRLVYGRRLLYAFLLSGIVATMLVYPVIKPESFGMVLAVLPGLFAYNLHREGRYLEGMSTFIIWFGVLLVAVSTVLWFLTDPDALSKIKGLAEGSVSGAYAFIDTRAPSVGAALADFSDSVSPALASARETASAAVTRASGFLDAALAAGVSLVAVAGAAEGGAE